MTKNDQKADLSRGLHLFGAKAARRVVLLCFRMKHLLQKPQARRWTNDLQADASPNAPRPDKLTISALTNSTRLSRGRKG